jgi:carbon storage regulator
MLSRGRRGTPSRNLFPSNGALMLILTRRPGESLHLGDNIKITVLGVQGKQIKIGLDVPHDMQVYREEVYLRVLEQNRQAMQASDQDVFAAADIWHKKTKE